MNRIPQADSPIGAVGPSETEAAGREGSRISSDVLEDDQQVLSVAEETLRVNKREVVTGRVRVRTVTRAHEELVPQDLARESVEIVRVPVDREIDEIPSVREEGDVTVVPVVEEILVVTKRLVLREEVHIRRTRSVERVETPIVLRRQEAVIERLHADGTIIPEETN